MFIVEYLYGEKVASQGPEIVELFSKGQCDKVLGVRQEEKRCGSGTKHGRSLRAMITG